MSPSVPADIAMHLETAWRRIPAGGGDFDLPDIVAFEDIRANWPIFREELVDSILANAYHPEHVDIVDLPKDRLTVRPLARLSPKDRLVYEACVFAMAPQIDAAIPGAVYSYRWGKRKSEIYAPVGSWLRMQRRGKYLHKHNPAHMLAKTDVTSFYEYVDIDILMEDLASLPTAAWARETLARFLRAFNDLNQAWGLPQGSDASGILANLYLLPVDVEIARAGITHLRYSDDIHLFGRDWLALRAVLLSITRILRARRLSLSRSKTRIIDSHSVRAEFEDSEKDILSYGITNYPIQAASSIRDYFDQVSAKDPVSPRDLRFALTKLRVLQDDHAVSWLLENLGEIPHLARESLLYLDKFFLARPNIAETLVDLLVNSKLAIYPYAEQHLLILLVRHRVASVGAKNEARRVLLDRNKEPYVREFAARYLGQQSGPGDGSLMKLAFQNESDVRVKRALLIACYEAGYCSEQLLRSVLASGGYLGITANYLLGGPIGIPIPSIERH